MLDYPIFNKIQQQLIETCRYDLGAFEKIFLRYRSNSVEQRNKLKSFTTRQLKYQLFFIFSKR